MLSPNEIPAVLSEVMDVRVALARPEVAIFRGPLIAPPERAYARVKEVFPNHTLILDEDAEVGARLALISDRGAEKERAHPWVALFLLLLTVVTTTVAGSFYAATGGETGALGLLSGLPYSLGLMAILGIHELGHYFAARRHHMRVTLPFFIPAPSALGTFGAFIRLKSPAPDRTALFDTAVAGPLAGLAVAIPVLFLGLRSSELTLPSLLPGELGQPTVNSSLLFGLIARAALPASVSPDTIIILSPLAFAGWIGLFVTALNLIPIGQLDGGHIVQALFGRRVGDIISSLATTLLFIVAIFFAPALLLWAFIVALIAGRSAPTMNELTPISPLRRFVGFTAIAVFLGIILPFPAP
jgi:membrane-associated protease RseP (regulator of RpoE activity)